MVRMLMMLTCLLSFSAHAFVVYDPTNFQQNLLTAKNSIESVKKQVEMIKMQVRTLKSLKHFHYRDVGVLLGEIDHLAKQGQSLSYSLEVFDKQFNKTYPFYELNDIGQDYPSDSHQQSKVTLNTLRNSLASIGHAARQIKEEHQLLSRLNKQSQSVEGQKQVSQVTNELLSECIAQIQLLRRLISLQANSQTAYMARNISRASHKEEALNQMAEEFSHNLDPVNQPRHFGLIEEIV